MIPTSTKVTVDVRPAVPKDAEAVVVFVSEGAELAKRSIDEAEREAAERLLSAGAFRGKPKEIDSSLVELPGGKVRRVVVVGLGAKEKLSPEVVRVAAGVALKSLRRHRVRRSAVIPPALSHDRPAIGAEACAAGIFLAAFHYEEYKAKKAGDDGQKKDAPLAVTIVAGQDAPAIREAVDYARVLCEGQNFARTIAFRPGNDINPPSLAKVAQAMAKEVGLRCRVLDEKQMKRLGMGGILAVGAGSNATPPRMIVLEHNAPRGKRARPVSPLLVVGKAITFDTGGVSIKPAEKMGSMVFDKCGGMAVLGLMCVLARLKVPAHVVGILTSAENHISETAYRPGDILRMYNGTTVEVTNTDAEGRLVLGDALSWGIETYKPAAVIDLATLTGACVVALGHSRAGAFCNDDGLFDELQAAASITGEKMWRLPMDDDYKDMLKSVPADIVNSPGRWGGACTAAAFLSHFIEKVDGRPVPWCHLDIAPVADTDKELPYYQKGATGWGVRTLVEWVRARAGA